MKYILFLLLFTVNAFAQINSFTWQEVYNGAAVVTQTSTSGGTNNTLQKTAGLTGLSAFDNILRSDQTITSGDGYIEFILSDNSKTFTVGFRNSNALPLTGSVNQSTTWDDVEFGMVNFGGAYYWVRNGSFAFTGTNSFNGDIVRIDVTSGVATIQRDNGGGFSTIYTFPDSPTYPMHIHYSARDLNSIANDISALGFAGAITPPPATDRGKLRNEDFQTEAQLIASGATIASLLNDNKIYVLAVAKTLDDAIADGDIIDVLASTAGDLIVGNGSEATTLPVGNNGHFLMADDNKTQGVQWYNGISAIDYDDNPVGTIIAYGSETIPSGYLLADGSCQSKVEYETLYLVVGGTDCDAGSGATSGFLLPDLRNQFLRGLTGGRTVFDSQADATAVNGLATQGDGAHGHTLLSGDSSLGNVNGYPQQKDTNNDLGTSTVAIDPSTGTHNHTLTGDAETRPANIAVVYLIKAQGKSPTTNVVQKAFSPDKAGFIIWSAFDGAVEGHRVANGDCVSITEFPDYFANVGYTHGTCDAGSGAGSGANLPDLVTDNRFIRAAGGSLAVGTTQNDQVENHDHYFKADQTGVKLLGGGTDQGRQNTDSNLATDIGDGTTHTMASGSFGAETRPNNIALYPLVRMVDRDELKGTFEQIEDVNIVLDETTANELTAVFSSVGTLARSNYDWITSTSQLNTGEYRIIYSGLGLTEIPNVVVSSNSPCVHAFTVSITTTQADITTRDNVGTNTNCSFNVQVSKQGVDVNKDYRGEVIQTSQSGKYIHRIGDCKYSILDQADFNSIHTGDWVRLEGQSIAGSDIDNRFGINSLPDAVSNGAFIRQVGGSSGAIRSFQSDQNKYHRHDTSDHPNGKRFGGWSATSPTTPPNNASAFGTSSTGTAELKTTYDGNVSDQEARPKNIALNFYCLISE